MEKEIRSGKSSILGITKASQEKLKDTKRPKLGDAPGRHPLFRLQSMGNVTWSYIFIYHMICVFLGASCILGVFAFVLSQSSLLHTFLRGTCTHREFVRILNELHLYLLS